MNPTHKVKDGFSISRGAYRYAPGDHVCLSAAEATLYQNYLEPLVGKEPAK